MEMKTLFSTVALKHTMVLSCYIINELYDVVERKFPGKIETIFLANTNKKRVTSKRLTP